MTASALPIEALEATATAPPTAQPYDGRDGPTPTIQAIEQEVEERLPQMQVKLLEEDVDRLNKTVNDLQVAAAAGTLSAQQTITYLQQRNQALENRIKQSSYALTRSAMAMVGEVTCKANEAARQAWSYKAVIEQQQEDLDSAATKIRELERQNYVIPSLHAQLREKDLEAEEGREKLAAAKNLCRDLERQRLDFEAARFPERVLKLEEKVKGLQETLKTKEGRLKGAEKETRNAVAESSKWKEVSEKEERALTSMKKELESAKQTARRTEDLIAKISSDRDSKHSELLRSENERAKLDKRLKDKAYRVRISELPLQAIALIRARRLLYAEDQTFERDKKIEAGNDIAHGANIKLDRALAELGLFDEADKDMVERSYGQIFRSDDLEGFLSRELDMEDQLDELMSTMIACSSFTARSPDPSADEEFLAIRESLKNWLADTSNNIDQQAVNTEFMAQPSTQSNLERARQIASGIREQDRSRRHRRA